MQCKWVTVTFDDGSKQIESLDESGNGSFEIPRGKRVAKIQISDQPEDPLAAAFAKAADPD